MPDSPYSTVSVSAADISRNFGEWQSRAMISPVAITHHGRPRLILQSVEQFEARASSPVRPDHSAEEVQATAQFRAVLSQLREGFFALDDQLRITDVNPAAEIFAGLARQDLIGRQPQEVRPATKGSVVWEHCLRVIRTKEPVEFRHQSAINRGVTLQVRAFPYDGGAGLLFTNISAEEDARQHQRCWAALSNAVGRDPSLAVIQLNVRGGIADADQNFARMTGFSRAQLATLLLTEIVHPRHRIPLAHAINLLIRENTPMDITVRILTHDGGEKDLRLNMSPTSDESGADGVVVCVVDADRPPETRRPSETPTFEADLS